MKLPNTYLRFAAIVLIIGIADILWVLFAQHPFPGAAVIAATTPLWVTVFVIIPMRRKQATS